MLMDLTFLYMFVRNQRRMKRGRTTKLSENGAESKGNFTLFLLAMTEFAMKLYEDQVCPYSGTTDKRRRTRVVENLREACSSKNPKSTSFEEQTLPVYSCGAQVTIGS